MAIAVVHRNRVVFAKGFGVRKIGSTERVDPNTVFQLASLSKPLASTVVAESVGRGLVKWSDPVSKHIPGFTLSDAYIGARVTLADMFAHRSGLPDHAGDSLEDLGYDRATILRRLSLESLDPFRITYHYTNFGLTAAAQAVANANSTSWEYLSRRRLYVPLGMNSTSSRYADYVKASDKAALHVRVAGHWKAMYARDADAQAPAGGASSSVRDMARWLTLELADGAYGGKQIVGKEALLATRVPQIVNGPPATAESRASFYGLGIGVSYDEAGRVRLSHSGAFNLGAATTFVLLPSEKLGIVVLTNGMPIGIPEAISSEFLDLAEFGKVERDWYSAYATRLAPLFFNPSALAGKIRPSKPRHARALTAYAGSYRNRFYGPAMIEIERGRLVMVLGPSREKFALSLWDADTFSYMPRGENAVGISAVTFSIAKAGRDARFVVENLNAEKLGTFTRR